jgi:hypothetical protein
MQHTCPLPLVLVLLLAFAAGGRAATAAGPLRVSKANPRYFAGPSGKPILLVGSHVWNNLVDMSPDDPPAAFDFDAYLDFLEKHHHNFIRLWAWELSNWDTRGNNARWRKPKPHVVAPLPWPRTGPGKAIDGKPKFDLTKLDPAYFVRLRSRVDAARRRGIYVAIMLFEGWGVQHAPGAWSHHPFHRPNNVNGIEADTNSDGKGLETHELGNSKTLAIQEAYVRKVVDTVNGLDNVLYEISNENHPPSTKWQYHMIRFIKDCEKAKPKQHPVGMTFQYRGGSNQALFDSPADWVSPNPQGGYRDDPPDTQGSKVVITDTDHLWGIGGDHAWVWKSFLRGLNPIFMDPYDGVVLGKAFDPAFADIREAMGHARRLSERMDLAAATPQGAVASSRTCLAEPGRQYAAYFPDGKGTIDLSGAEGRFAVEWIHPRTGKSRKAGPVEGGAKRQFAAPFQGDAVLFLDRK